MKRKVCLAAGAAALGLAVYFGSRLWAQAPTAAVPAPPQTRVAFVNLVQVIKGYHKYLTFEGEQKKTAAPFETEIKELQKRLQGWQDVIDHPEKYPAETRDRETAEKNLRDVKRQLEDQVAEGKKALGKTSEVQMVQLYREVEDAVQLYARSNGFHVVLQFNEPPTQAERYGVQNVRRKLESGAAIGCCIPVYMAPGLDISEGVITNLNAGQRATTGPAGATAAH